MAGQAVLQHRPEEQLCREGDCCCRAVELSAWLPCSALLLHPGFPCPASRRPERRGTEISHPSSHPAEPVEMGSCAGIEGAKRALAQHLTSVSPFGAV